jgi:hypothetical protein
MNRVFSSKAVFFKKKLSSFFSEHLRNLSALTVVVDRDRVSKCIDVFGAKYGKTRIENVSTFSKQNTARLVSKN